MPTSQGVRGDDVALVIVGDLDMASCDEPVAALESVLVTHPGGRVVVDVGAVSFVDSSGLNCLLRLRSRCHEDGRTLVLRDVGAKLTHLLALTGLDPLFTTEDAPPPDGGL